VSKRANLGRLAAAVIVAAVAIVLIFTGLGHEQAPKCNNVTMKPGDLCILSTGAVTYEQRKADSSRVGLIQLGIAGTGVIVSVVLFGLYLRDRRRASTVPPSTSG
jgi:hypothetical protein